MILKQSALFHRRAAPPYLQDAVDNMLADEALAKKGESRPLRELLAETGEVPGQ